MEDPAHWCYNECVKNKNNTKVYSTPIQLKLPVDLEKIIKINDPVYSFSEAMAHIDLNKYFVEKKEHETDRPRYDREKLLKIVLFSFDVNAFMALYQRAVFEVRQEYAVEYVAYMQVIAADEQKHPGRGHIRRDQVEQGLQTAAPQRDRSRNFGVRLNILRF